MRAPVYLFGIASLAFSFWALLNIVVWQFNISSYRTTREPLIGAFYLLLTALMPGLLSVAAAWLSRKSLRRTDIQFVRVVVGGFVAITVALIFTDATAA